MLSAPVGKDGPSATIILKPGSSQAAVNALVGELRGRPGVDRAAQRSADEAMAEFNQVFADNPDLRDSIDPGVLPPSVRAVTADNATAEQLKAEFGSRPDVIQVSVVKTTRVVDFVATGEPLSVAMPAGWPSQDVLDDLVRAAPTQVKDDIETMKSLLTRRDSAGGERVQSPTDAARAIREHAQHACGIQTG